MASHCQVFLLLCPFETILRRESEDEVAGEPLVVGRVGESQAPQQGRPRSIVLSQSVEDGKFDQKKCSADNIQWNCGEQIAAASSQLPRVRRSSTLEIKA